MVSLFGEVVTVARVNILKRVKTLAGWTRIPLLRNPSGRLMWDARPGHYYIEWRENGRRLRAAAGRTPSDALEAQKRKRLELEAKQSGFQLSGPSEVKR